MPSLEEILTLLGDEDEETRHAAVRQLAPFGEEALPHLGTALGDGSWRVRKAAVEGVTALGGTAPMEILLEGIRDDGNAGRRNTCMEALIRVGSQAVPFISSLLEDEDPDVRKFGVDILGNIDDLRTFEPLLRALEDAEENVAAAAAEYLGKKRHGPAAAPLVNRLERGGFWVKFSCVRALGEIGDPGTGEAVLRHAGDKGLRTAALEALGRMGVSAAEPQVLEGLFSKDRGLRQTAVVAAARLDRTARKEGRDGAPFRESIARNADCELREYLRGLLEREDMELRRAAMVVLGAAAGSEAVAHLVEALHERAVLTVPAILSSLTFLGG